MSARKYRKTSTVIIYVIMFSAALFWLYPYAWMIMSSIKPNNNIFTTSLFQGPFTFDNYVFMFTEVNKLQMPIFRAFINSVGIAFIAMFCVLASSAIVAYGLAKHEFKGKKFIIGFIIFQMVFPSFMFLLPKFILMKNLGLINTYPGIFLVYIVGAGWIFMFYQSFKGTPTDYIEAARMDGAGEFWIIFRLMMPLNRAIIAIVGIFAFTGAWNDYLWPFIVMQDYTKMPLGVMLANFNMQFSKYQGSIMAACTLLTLPVVVGFICLRKHFLKGINISLK